MSTPSPSHLRPNERGSVLAGTLVLIFGLLAAAMLAAMSGWTNLLTASNLRAATGAQASAESAINEAVYRLSLPDTDAAAIVPTLTNPDWNVGIHYTTGDNNAADHTLSTIQSSADWPDSADPMTAAVTMRFKRDAANHIVFYNRAIPGGNPPFLSVNLPNPVGTIVGQTYELLCNVPSILGLQVGGVLGLCPNTVTVTGYPVVEIAATGVDARGARRELVAEAARSIAYVPLAPFMVGGNVNFNGNGFIDGVNHDHRIFLTAAAGAAAVYGDDNAETSESLTLLGLPISVHDSPDDCNLWTGGPLLLPLPPGAIRHGVANASLLLYFQLTPPYTSFPRLYNKQLSSTDPTSAWVGVSQLTNAITTALNLPGLGSVLATNLGIWTGMNFGYSAPIALSPTATISNPPAVTPNTNTSTWTNGVFSWRTNNMNNAAYSGSVNLATDTPAVNTVVECGPTVQGQKTPNIVCRPSGLATFPPFQYYLGIDELPFQDRLANATRTRANLDAGQSPLGFTYIEGNYTLGAGVPSPGTNDFGIMYVNGNLTVQGRHTYKGLIYVNGNVQVDAGGHLIVLGAMMTRGTYTHVGTGRLTLLYSREASLRGLVTVRPWRVLSWIDTAMQD